jgi:hypothetical protein
MLPDRLWDPLAIFNDSDKDNLSDSTNIVDQFVEKICKSHRSSLLWDLVARDRYVPQENGGSFKLYSPKSFTA